MFSQNFTRLLGLHVHIYAKLQNVIRLPPTLTKLYGLEKISENCKA